MSIPAAATPPRMWVRFTIDEAPSESEIPPDCRVNEYDIERVEIVKGADADAGLHGRRVTRLESPTRLVPGRGDLAAVTQHVLYTDAPLRRELVSISSAESGPVAVLIPISKSAAWWAMAQEERTAQFRSSGSAKGHFAIGASYAARIFRRLYHARYLPGATWDFLTYFEFPREDEPTFRALLAELRDPCLNPEWEFVEREVEIWMQKR